MSSLENKFEKACADGIIPGAVLMAANRDGTFRYTKGFGVRSLSTKQPMELDTFMYIASCTKLLTSIAALQCVECGLVRLDDDVAKTLPELAALPILAGFEKGAEGEPILKQRQRVITLRHLLTHAAGSSYDMLSPQMVRYRKQRGEFKDFAPTLVESSNRPLLYEPGTGWSYGYSVDWAGRLVERLTGRTLEEYMQANIFIPLGISEIAFWPDKYPELKAKAAHMSRRSKDGSGKVVHGGEEITVNVTDCFGGHGAHASMRDYFKVLQSLLADDEKLLKKETTRAMFEPQLSEQSRDMQKHIFSDLELSKVYIGEFPEGVALDWGLAGLLIRDDMKGWRRKGTLCWSGMPNLFWFIDREAGLCGLYGGQVMPPGDKQVEKMITLFEKAMYKRSAAGVVKAKI